MEKQNVESVESDASVLDMLEWVTIDLERAKALIDIIIVAADRRAAALGYDHTGIEAAATASIRFMDTSVSKLDSICRRLDAEQNRQAKASK
jgi:hypothetical protein